MGLVFVFLNLPISHRVILQSYSCNYLTVKRDISYENTVSDHYVHGSLLSVIKSALPAIGKTTENVTIEDLAPVDEFHIGGRFATDHLCDQFMSSGNNKVLDVGCGLGGAARYVATKYNSQVVGIDLTLEYIETGNALCEWLSLEESVLLDHGSALSMPYTDSEFDAGYMLHVGMNIENKGLLFAEIARVLKPGATFGVYDIMKINEGQLVYPVPWATNMNTNKLSTVDHYKLMLEKSGFKIINVESRLDFALGFFQKLRAKTNAGSGPPPLGLHVLMRESTTEKLKNMIENISNNRISPVEIIATKV